MTEIAGRVAAVRERIADAARRAGRDPASVALVAATKTVDVARIADALAAGVTELGENRAQELTQKAPALLDAPPHTWHFLGSLQRNKVRGLAPLVALWHSVDRDSLAEEIARRSPGARVLLEVNLAAEPQKSGAAPSVVGALSDRARACGLEVVGLMAVPPAGDDPRPWFAQLRALAAFLGVRELSMGMSDDFEVAIEEGATIVRVGRALFGDRPAIPTA
jgi:pyridoxal phosphate enzyme (YggS family)